MYTYNGRQYNTIEQFADEYLMSADAIRERMNIGMSFEDAVWNSRISIRMSNKEVVYKGVKYKSFTELVEKLKLRNNSIEVINRRLQGEDLETAIYNVLCTCKLDDSPSYINKGNKKTVIYKGKRYLSKKELALEYNVDYSMLLKLTRQGLSIDDTMERLLHPVTRTSRYNGVNVEYEGAIYNSYKELAQHYGIDHHRLLMLKGNIGLDAAVKQCVELERKKKERQERVKSNERKMENKWWK